MAVRMFAVALMLALRAAPSWAFMENSAEEDGDMMQYATDEEVSEADKEMMIAAQRAEPADDVMKSDEFDPGAQDSMAEEGKEAEDGMSSANSEYTKQADDAMRDAIASQKDVKARDIHDHGESHDDYGAEEDEEKEKEDHGEETDAQLQEEAEDEEEDEEEEADESVYATDEEVSEAHKEMMIASQRAEPADDVMKSVEPQPGAQDSMAEEGEKGEDGMSSAKSANSEYIRHADNEMRIAIASSKDAKVRDIHDHGEDHDDYGAEQDEEKEKEDYGEETDANAFLEEDDVEEEVAEEDDEEQLLQEEAEEDEEEDNLGEGSS